MIGLKKRKRSIGTLISFVVVSLVAISQIFPLIWLVDFSLLKSGDLFGAEILKWPNPPQWGNYTAAWTQGKIPSYLKNSIFVTLVSILLIIILSAMLGYAISRMKWKLKGFVFGFLMLGMMIPIHSTLLPNFIIFDKIGILDSYLALIIPYVAFQIPISTLLMTGFMANLPRSLEEAAIIDGCNIFDIIFRIIVPIVKPAIVTVSVMAFIGIWNEFIMAATYISSEAKKTLPFAILNFTGEYMANYSAQFAILTLIALPSVIIYLILSEQVTRGVAEGAVKG